MDTHDKVTGSLEQSRSTAAEQPTIFTAGLSNDWQERNEQDSSCVFIACQSSIACKSSFDALKVLALADFARPPTMAINQRVLRTQEQIAYDSAPKLDGRRVHDLLRDLVQLTKLELRDLSSHLDYMLYELLKNAMRAVVERHRGRALPPLHVAICKAQSSVTLRIADQGGGIPDDQLDKVFQYGFTTVGAQDSTVPVSAGPL